MLWLTLALIKFKAVIFPKNKEKSRVSNIKMIETIILLIFFIYISLSNYFTFQGKKKFSVLGIIAIILLFGKAITLQEWSILGTLFLALLIENIWSRKEFSWTSQENLLSLGISSFQSILVIGVQVAVYGKLLTEIPPGSGHWGLSFLGFPLIFQILIYLVIEDLKRYWFHRLDHSSSFFWRFHKIHHSPTQLNYIIGNRDYPTFGIGHMLSDIGLAYLLGITGNALIIGLAIRSFLGGFIAHTDVNFPPIQDKFPWWFYVIVTPNFHAWHHTTHCKYNANLADIFPFWDVMFGTFEAPYGDPQKWQFGLEKSSQIPNSIWGQLLSPFSDNKIFSPDGVKEILGGDI